MEKEKQGTENYKAIPLTEEWLIRFWFKEEVNRPSWLGPEIGEQRWQIRLTSRKSGGYVWSSATFGITVDLQYVHTLQNLIFSLTNSELEIKS
jgi:hypothetical protein